MQPESPDWTCALDAKAKLGECPTWDGQGQALFWIDSFAPSLNRLDPVTAATRSWALPDPVGSFALVEGRDAAVVALGSGLHELDLATGATRLLHAARYDQTHYRFNDGRCDRQGRFWVGTTRLHDSDHADGGASVWRLERGALSQQITGTTIANGTAFSPDGRTMYLADRPNWCILAFDFDPERGVASNRRVFARVPEGHYPDGAAVDAEGGYWCALFRAGLIARFAPDGRLDRLLKAPSLMPTMICFGGEDLGTMFVTTTAWLLGKEGRAREPQGGGVFRCDVGARGLPEPRYRP
jgi:sugar lactone lactonase YvrE